MLPPYIEDDKEWSQKFEAAIEKFSGSDTPEESAETLRELLKSGLIRFSDLQKNPERFFKSHRYLLAPTRTPDGSGAGVRYTVLVNLFGGSILGLGSDEQVNMLEEFQERGVLGCFCLTEKFAGVNSGLVVQTTAIWNEETQQFTIHCPTEGAAKNWISQGSTASHAVIIANLGIAGKFYGPHAFVAQIRDEQTGELLPGVSSEDLGRKSVANDLDNSAISFNQFVVPKSALLNRFADVRDNKYVQTTERRMTIETVGQRLLTGRLAIAQASIVYAETLFKRAKQYADNKPCWAPKGQKQPSLSEVPHIAAIFAEGFEQLSTLQRYNFKIEELMIPVLKNREIPSAQLVEQIAVAKVKSVQTAITLTDKLARELGSYALMYESGLGTTHWLLMCQFAEGDTRILQQKLARDSMKKFKATSWKDTGKEIVFGTSAEQQEMKVRFQLSHALSSAAGPEDAGRLWNENYALVYELAETVCARHIADALDEGARESLFSKL